MPQSRLTQFNLKTVFFFVLVTCLLINWHAPTLSTMVTLWLSPPEPQRKNSSDSRVFTVIWQSTGKQEPPINSGDLVDVVWIPADGSTPQQILESVTMIILNYTSSPPRQGTGLVVTPQQVTALRDALSNGTLQWYPVSDGP